MEIHLPSFGFAIFYQKITELELVNRWRWHCIGTGAKKYKKVQKLQKSTISNTVFASIVIT